MSEDEKTPAPVRINEQLASGQPTSPKGDEAWRAWDVAIDARRGGPATARSPLPQTVVDSEAVEASRPMVEPEAPQKVGGRSAHFSTAQRQAWDAAAAGMDAPGRRMTELEEALSSGAPVTVPGVSLMDIREALAEPLADVTRELARVREHLRNLRSGVDELRRAPKAPAEPQKVTIEIVGKAAEPAPVPTVAPLDQSRVRPENRGSHPGTVLVQDFLRAPYGDPVTPLMAKEFAAKTGMTTAHLKRLIEGRASVTAKVAVALAAALGTTPEFWLTLQAGHDLSKLRGEAKGVQRKGARKK